VGRLAYFERYEEATVAARRERALKRWRRDWKIELIEKHTPTWRDLFSEVLAEEGFEV
jgi:putative endonuclease